MDRETREHYFFKMYEKLKRGEKYKWYYNGQAFLRNVWNGKICQEYESENIK